MDGEILKGCFTNTDIHKKTILVSLEGEGDINVPSFLNDRELLCDKDDDFYDSIMNCIIAD